MHFPQELIICVASSFSQTKVGRKGDFPLKKEKKDSNFTNVDLNSAVIRDKKRKIKEMGTYPSDLDELAVSGGAEIRVGEGMEEERNGSIC